MDGRRGDGRLGSALDHTSRPPPSTGFLVAALSDRADNFAETDRRGHEGSCSLMPQEPARPRIWPGIVIALIVAAVLAWTWTVDAADRQDRVLRSALTIILGVLGLALWAFVFARFSPRVRKRIALATLAIAAAGLLLFRHKGFSGDMVPEFAFRFGRTEADTPIKRGGSTAGFATDVAPTDFPQFLGPDRTGVLRGIPLARDWSKAPPKEVWRRPIGLGWSGFAVVGGHFYTQEQRGEQELVVCRALDTGDVVWSHGATAAYRSTVAGDGPRATPTVTRQHVIAVGSTGLVTCLDRVTGEARWSDDVLRRFGTEVPAWGYSCSPLVIPAPPATRASSGAATLAIVTAGGKQRASLVAYDAAKGTVVWNGGSSSHGYASPILTTLAGTSQIVVLNNRSAAGHDPATGAELWKYPWPGKFPKVPQPLVVDANRVLISSGYGVGSALVRIEKQPDGTFTANREWHSKRLKAKFSNSIVIGDAVYGLDDGVLTCIDLATGERKWKRGRYGHGQVYAVDGLLLITTERGEVVLVDPKPDALHERTRFRAFDAKCWACPALVGHTLLLRSEDEIACFRLPLADRRP